MKINKPPAYVQSVISTYPKSVQRNLLAVRKLIFEVAEQDSNIGSVVETLKWNEPSYTTKPKTGTTIRIAWHNKKPDKYGLYVPCSTTLVSEFKRKFKTKHEYDGTRGILFDINQKVLVEDMKYFIKEALIYHKRK
jgi:hypothetical protein